jgi:hypothetical protein
VVQQVPISRREENVGGRHTPGRRRKKLPDNPMAAVRKLTDAWIAKDPVEMSRWLTDDITEIGPAFPGALVGKVNFTPV